MFFLRHVAVSVAIETLQELRRPSELVLTDLAVFVRILAGNDVLPGDSGATAPGGRWFAAGSLAALSEVMASGSPLRIALGFSFLSKNSRGGRPRLQELGGPRGCLPTGF